jgi:hypothetical protein
MMPRYLFILAAICFFGNAQSYAQKILLADQKKLRLMDDSLNKYGIKVLDEILPANRLRADSMFTRILVRALKTTNSFYFKFDSMRTAPVVYPDDSSFRIITWHYTPDDANYHQRGVIQVNTPDGSLKIFPLYDASEFTTAPQDSVRTPQNWIGAVYYKIIQKKTGDKTFYTLLGYDENNMRTTRKWMEMLSFNERGEPRFGGSFTIPPDSTNPRPTVVKRYLMEYKKDASAKLNYDPEEDLIVMDHLVSESNEPQKKFTLVPGGDYEAFKWQNGTWLNETTMYIENRGDNNEPRPATILSDNGDLDESKLNEISEKNMGTKKTATPAKAAPAKAVKKKKD